MTRSSIFVSVITVTSFSGTNGRIVHHLALMPLTFHVASQILLVGFFGGAAVVAAVMPLPHLLSPREFALSTPRCEVPMVAINGELSLVTDIGAPCVSLGEGVEFFVVTRGAET